MSRRTEKRRRQRERKRQRQLERDRRMIDRGRVLAWFPPALDVDEALDLADEVLKEIQQIAEGDHE